MKGDATGTPKILQPGIRMRLLTKLCCVILLIIMMGAAAAAYVVYRETAAVINNNARSISENCFIRASSCIFSFFVNGNRQWQVKHILIQVSP